jgi:hypothetical protein
MCTTVGILLQGFRFFQWRTFVIRVRRYFPVERNNDCFVWNFHNKQIHLQVTTINRWNWKFQLTVLKGFKGSFQKSGNSPAALMMKYWTAWIDRVSLKILSKKNTLWLNRKENIGGYVAGTYGGFIIFWLLSFSAS